MIKIGHRGCAHYPENTLESFKWAIHDGADMIECDVWLTRDKKLVIIHDDYVDRTTNGRGKVNDYSFYNIRRLKIKGGTHKDKVPTLEETIKTVKNKAQLNLEIKDQNSIDLVLKTVKKLKFSNNILISSPKLKTLQKVKKFDPKIRTGLLLSPSSTKFRTMLKVLFNKLTLPFRKKSILNRLKTNKIDYLNLNYTLATKKYIDYFHKNKIKLLIWTVNDEKKIKKFKKLKVDGIFSDFPERLK